MHRTHMVMSVLLLVATLLVACAPAGVPAPVAPAPAASGAAAAPVRVPAAAPAAPAKAAWEIEWEKTLEAAKKEGRIVFNIASAAEVRTALVRDIKNAYGLEAEAVTGRSNEINAKILSERRAGLYLWDVTVGGATSPYTELEPVGAIEPLDSALILPDVTDPEVIKKTWYRGDLWWIDSNHLLLSALMGPYPPLAVNTNLVKPGDIKSYNDFLDPKWKGKININDPTQAGTSLQWFIIQTFGPDWFRKLLSNEPVIMRDQRLQGDWLAHGKAAIALGIKDTIYTEIKGTGAPIQVVIPAEGTWLSGGSGAIAMFNKAAHPNAAKMFINWLMTKDVQTTFSRLSGIQSTREDVPTNFLDPELIRKPGVKYLEAYRKKESLQKAEDMKLAKEIFAPLLK